MILWDTGCVMSLANCIATDDRQGMAAWIAEHVDGDDGWQSLAALLSELTASFVDDTTRRALDTGDPIQYAPGDVDGNHTDHLAVLMVSMSLNVDKPGILGVLASVRAAGELEGFCGTLAAIAGLAMRGSLVRIVEAL